MKIKFSIKSLLLLTAAIAGLVTAVDAACENFDKGLYYKPQPIPELLAARIQWQFICGLVLLGVAVVFGLLRRRKK